jgi:hypothetical protein
MNEENRKTGKQEAETAVSDLPLFFLRSCFPHTFFRAARKTSIEARPPLSANARLDHAGKTALPNVSRPTERKRLWNLKISKPSSI